MPHFMLTESTARLATASRSAIRTYKGIGVSPGIAIGRAVIIERREAAIYRVPIRDDEVPSEVNRFLEALEKTQTQLHDLKQRVKRSMGDEYAQIFEAHAMMVSDPSFADKVIQKIEAEQVNAEWAMSEVQEELQARFLSFNIAHSALTCSASIFWMTLSANDGSLTIIACASKICAYSSPMERFTRCLRS